MSRAYWVKLSSSVTETVNASDRATHRIELDAVVPEAEMKDIVQAALEESGWTRDEDGRTFRRRMGDIELVWNVEENVVEATVESSQDVTRDVQVEGRAYSQTAAEQSAQRQLQQREQTARDAIAAEAEQLQKQLTRKLTDSEQERVREINGVLQKAYTEGLKRKARRLGNITSIQEGTNDKGDYELTITISE